MKPKKNRKPGAMDNCQTPAYALDPLVPYLKAANIHTIWECASGEGYMVQALEDSGFGVIATDIKMDEVAYDFFNIEAHNIEDVDAIVTNPPYSIKYEWTERCYELGKPWALLMPVEFLGTVHGGDLFDEHGVQVIMMRPRINFKMPNKGWDGKGAQFPVAWYTWGLNLPSDLLFKRVNRR